MSPETQKQLQDEISRLEDENFRMKLQIEKNEQRVAAIREELAGQEKLKME